MSMDKGAWFAGPKMVLGGTNNPFTPVFVVVVLGCLFFFGRGADVFLCIGLKACGILVT